MYVVDGWSNNQSYDIVDYDGNMTIGVTKSIELMQYTGLKDKNGNDIYEGDIVDLPGYGQRKIIEWGIFSADGEAFGYENIDTEDAEVIGNIHTDSHLLKEKNKDSIFPEVDVNKQGAVMNYTTINGKCVWCGADAATLTAEHFEQHEKEEH